MGLGAAAGAGAGVGVGGVAAGACTETGGAVDLTRSGPFFAASWFLTVCTLWTNGEEGASLGLGVVESFGGPWGWIKE